MQLISALTISILALVMSISASPAKPVALTPDAVAAAGLTNIHDFQGNSLNLVGNVNPTEGTGVIGFPGGFDGSNFIIANGLNMSLFLSYPAAPFAGNPAQAGAVVFSEFPAVFSLQVVAPPSSAVSIVEVTHQLALTSWPSVPGVNAAPVTLASISSVLQAEQTWNIVAAVLLKPNLWQLNNATMDMNMDTIQALAGPLRGPALTSEVLSTLHWEYVHSQQKLFPDMLEVEVEKSSSYLRIKTLSASGTCVITEYSWP
ncbi:hypothetical protein FB451DRAFT_1187549 [Mycena latifolia]|nr:hypothetical protein FB451DRAFT_1187549 [Mycena latifolia]